MEIFCGSLRFVSLLFKKNVNCAMIFYKISDFWCCITGVML